MKNIKSKYSLLYIYDKIKNKSIKYLLSIFLFELSQKLRSYRSPLFINLRFYYYAVKLFVNPLNNNGKRVLGVWDYKSLPWSVGDPMLFIEYLSVIKIKTHSEAIDICIVYDKKKPLGKRTSFFGDPVNSKTHEDFSLEYLPIFSTCPFLGSIYQFNTRDEFNRFIKINYNRYNMYPRLSDHLAETFDYRDQGASLIKEIESFYAKYKYIPFLRIGDKNNAWARYYYAKNAPKDSVIVTISIKQTSHDKVRNTDPDTWLSFIDRCKHDYPEVVFCIVCLAEEVFDGLRQRENVIIAKDYGTTLIEDMALIRNSVIYMGTVSGINIIALFSDLPYLLFQSPSNAVYNLLPGENFEFSSISQKLFSLETSVTPSLLYNEFKEIYSKIDTNIWMNKENKMQNKHSSHPSAWV